MRGILLVGYVKRELPAEKGATEAAPISLHKVVVIVAKGFEV